MDTVVIDFISYTENKISRFLVLEFIISLLLKGKEPLYQEVYFHFFEIDGLETCNFLDAIQTLSSINTELRHDE